MNKTAFKIDTSLNVPLSRQLAEAMKMAIVRRKFKPGDVLPSIDELAAECATSAKVPRRALEMLAEDGWTRPVRGIGSIVLDRGEDAKSNGRVLFYVRHTGFSYYCSGFMAVLDDRLMAKGYKTFIVNASGRSETPACRRFESKLKEKWSLVALIGCGTEARRIAAGSGHPFILIGCDGAISKSSGPSCIGSFNSENGRAMGEFAKACVRGGVKRVVQFKYDNSSLDAAAMLAGAEIDVETAGFHREATPEAVARASLAQMRRIIARGCLPDLFLFTDDYLAQGALIALSTSGIRIPEDVKVATIANKGLGPIWPRPLSRFEVDPVAHGRAAAAAILEFLERGNPPQAINLGHVWKKGETL